MTTPATEENAALLTVERADHYILNTLTYTWMSATSNIAGRETMERILREYGLERLISNPPPNTFTLDGAIRASEYANLVQSLRREPDGTEIQFNVGRRLLKGTGEAKGTLMGLLRTNLPERMLIGVGLDRMAQKLKASDDTLQVWVEKRGATHMAFYDATCGFCYGHKASEPVCDSYRGALFELCHFLTGKDYAIVETDCMAMGAAYCRFEVRPPATGSLQRGAP